MWGVLLLILFWSLCCGQDLVCPPTVSSGVNDYLSVDSFVPLTPVTLVLLSGSTGPPFAIDVIEYATGQRSRVVPYAIVTQVLPSPSGQFFVFTTLSSGLYVVPQFCNTGGQPSALLLGTPMERFVFSPDSSRLLFVSGGALYSLALGGSAPSTPTLLSSVVEGSFAVTPDSSLVVFRNASGVFKTSVSVMTSQSIWGGRAAPGDFFVNADSSLVAFVQLEDLFVQIAPLGTGNNNAVSPFQAKEVHGWAGATLFATSVAGEIWGARKLGESWTWQKIATGEAVLLIISTGRCAYVSSGKLWSGAVRPNSTIVDNLLLSPANETWTFAKSSFLDIGLGWFTYLANNDTLMVALSQGPVTRSVALSENAQTVWKIGRNGQSLGFVGVGWKEWNNGSFAVPSYTWLNGLELVVDAADATNIVFQPNGVSVVFVSNAQVWVGCVVPPVILGDGEALDPNAVVPGHLFVTNTSSISQGTQVGGTAVLVGGATVSLVKCPYGSVSIVQASFILGSFDPSAVSVNECTGCTVSTPNSVAESPCGTLYVQNVPQQVCPGFSWVIVGVVLGCTGAIAIMTFVVLFLWNRRETLRARNRLEKKELKYRAIQSLVPMQ